MCVCIQISFALLLLSSLLLFLLLSHLLLLRRRRLILVQCHRLVINDKIDWERLIDIFYWLSQSESSKTLKYVQMSTLMCYNLYHLFTFTSIRDVVFLFLRKFYCSSIRLRRYCVVCVPHHVSREFLFIGFNEEYLLFLSFDDKCSNRNSSNSSNSSTLS